MSSGERTQNVPMAVAARETSGRSSSGARAATLRAPRNTAPVAKAEESTIRGASSKTLPKV